MLTWLVIKIKILASANVITIVIVFVSLTYLCTGSQEILEVEIQKANNDDHQRRVRYRNRHTDYQTMRYEVVFPCRSRVLGYNRTAYLTPSPTNWDLPIQFIG